METDLVNKINELVSLCKNVVKEQQKGDDTLAEVNALHVRTTKEKASGIAEQLRRKRIRKQLQTALKEAESLQEALLKMQAKIMEIKSIEHNIKISKGPRNLRRGVLMSMLQESAKSLPLWAGKLGESPPILCGAIPALKLDATVVAPGDHVASLVPDLETRGTDSDANESWILAEVVSFNPDKETFQVDDVDAEEGKVRYTLDRTKVITLPKWKANPVINPEAVFTKGMAQDEYSLYFEDPSYPDGYAPAIQIPQRYVIACPNGEVQNPGNAVGRKRVPSASKKR